VVVTYRPRRGTVLSVEELRRERVGTVAGTSMADAIAAAGVPPANVDASYTTETVVDALRSGKVAAVVLGIERAMLLNRRSPEFEIGTYVGPPGRLAFGVRQQDARLLADLNAYLVVLRQSGRWSQLVVKYFGPTAPDVLRKARAAG
jgi:polar amino acid transport system substrate-binding protein